MKATLRFFAVEKITFSYILITSLIILSLKPLLANYLGLLGFRLFIVFLIISLTYVNSIKNCWLIRFSRFAFLGVLLVYWYPETYDINRVLPNYDYLLAGWEQWIFGLQPTLLFSQLYPQHWISELLYMGYFAYYPLIVGTSLYFYFKDKYFFEYFFFTVLFSFFVYYLIYILFPTAGPQYYFQVIGNEQVQTGIFPQIGNYFNGHRELLSKGNDSGFFSMMVDNTQQIGERPTAAFPSSHVGISTLVMSLVLKNKRYFVFAFLFPFYLALVFATVYIQAHYVIDVFAGLISASILYFLSGKVYSLYTRRYEGIPELVALFVKEPVKKP